MIATLGNILGWYYLICIIISIGMVYWMIRDDYKRDCLDEFTIGEVLLALGIIVFSFIFVPRFFVETFTYSNSWNWLDSLLGIQVWKRKKEESCESAQTGGSSPD